MNCEDRLRIGEGDTVAFRQTGVHVGLVLDVFRSKEHGRFMLKVKGLRGSRGATIWAMMAERIPGADEVIIKKSEYEALLALKGDSDGVTGD